MILSGPGVRSGYTSAYPARLVDVAPTMETLLGITPAQQDGIPLADAMTSPPAIATAAQAQTAAQRQVDVTALKQEATLSLAAEAHS
jgi:hypothetical protein